MKNIFSILLIIALLPFQQATNILSVNYTFGFDVGNCKTLPCKTIPYAINQAQSGDVIEVAGIHPPFSVSKSGLYFDGANATIDGSLSSTTRGIQVLRGADNVTITGFTVKNTRSHAIITNAKNTSITNNRNENSVLERLSGGGWGSCIKSDRDATDVLVEGNIIIGCNGEAIGITMTIGGVVRNNYIYNAFSVGIYPDNSNGVLIENNTVICTGDSAFLRNGQRASGIVVGEEATGSWYQGWGAQARDITIQNNYIEGCSTGVYVFQSEANGTTTNLLITNNIIPSGTSFAISIDNPKCSNVVVKDNKVWKTNIWTRCNSGRTLSNNVLYTFIGTPTPSDTTPVTFTSAPSLTPTLVAPTATPTRTPTTTRTPTLVAPTTTPQCYFPVGGKICFWSTP